VLRYAVPVILAFLFAASILLAVTHPFYMLAGVLQALFYFLALAGWLIELSGRRLTLLAMPLYFVLANLAAVVAFYKFMRGETYARWEPIRQTR
jgi:hypothetical protein